MKLFKGFALLTQEDLDKALKDAEESGKDKGLKSSAKRIEDLEKALERKEKAYQKTNDELTDSKTRVQVLESDRDDVRKVLTKSMENEDLAAVLNTKKDLLDKREARLKDRESKLESDEVGRYKVGYADGVADGVRKVSEITQKDRDNAMKIAMVSAASHTPVANLQEVNSEFRLTQGSQNTEEE